MRFLPYATLPFLLLSAGSLAGQPDPVVRVEVRLAQIEVRVTDKNGHPVRGLKRENFSLEESGVAQEITTFRFQEEPGLAHIPPTEGESVEVDQLTWVSVLPEVRNALEFKRVEPALRTFFSGLPAGFMVSIGGLPFTSNKNLLLATLGRMSRGAYSGGADRTGTVDPGFVHYDDLVFRRDLAQAQRIEWGILFSIPGLSRDLRLQRREDQPNLLSVEQIDRQILLFGEAALLRYLDMVETIAPYPGKKVVLLLRSGLPFYPNHFGLMREISATAVRQRVSFYILDPRGLKVVDPVDDSLPTFATTRSSFRASNTSIVGKQAAQTESQDGLAVLARESEGRLVSDSNDLGRVFRHLVDDSGDYYVLGYSPKDLQEDGGFRKIRVSLDVPQLRVRAPRGYYERNPPQKQSRREKSIALRRAMFSKTPGPLPVRISATVLADADGQPLIIVSAGVEPGRVQPRRRKERREVTLSALGRLSSLDSRKLPVYLEKSLEYGLQAGQWDHLLTDPTVLLSYTSRAPVSPGRYSWKVVMKDEVSGRLGAAEAIVDVPDFSEASTPSDLLVTGRISPQPGAPRQVSSKQPDALQEMLSAGGTTYLPQAQAVFRQGETIHLFYQLYNPTPEDLDQASRGMQLGLFRNNQPVQAVDMWGQPFPDQEGAMLRFTAGIQTAGLEPGLYTAVVLLPNHERRKIPHLEADFQVAGTDAVGAGSGPEIP